MSSAHGGYVRVWQGVSLALPISATSATDSNQTQSTLAIELSAILSLPCIHLDHFYWQPGWREPGLEDFRSRVFATLDKDPRGWVADGKYYGHLGSKVTDAATDVICRSWRVSPVVH